MKPPAIFVGVLAVLAALVWQGATPEAMPPEDAGVLAAPAVHTDEHGVVFTEISVLTYNVNAFPWPLHLRGAASMTEIGRGLRKLRREGRAPDVVLVQEGFSDDARLIADVAGYTFHARGTTRADALAAAHESRDDDFVAGADWRKGETLGPVLGSGLHVFSRFPILDTSGSAFGRFACAGYDCLAGKGVLGVHVDVPGVPGGVSLFTTHLNANRRAGVSQTRSGRAYELQLARLKSFLETRIASDAPVIFGGDFNIKNQERRRTQAAQLLASFSMVHRYCDENRGACRQDYHGDRRSGWLEPRDIQGFRDGARVRVAPVAVEALFDGGDDGALLSDHIGYLVKYRLTWKAQADLSVAGVPFVRGGDRFSAERHTASVE